MTHNDSGSYTCTHEFNNTFGWLKVFSTNLPTSRPDYLFAEHLA